MGGLPTGRSERRPAPPKLPSQAYARSPGTNGRNRDRVQDGADGTFGRCPPLPAVAYNRGQFRRRGPLGTMRHIQCRNHCPLVMADYRLTHLEMLEAESIHIFREVAAELERPVLLFSGGKDSIVMLRLAEKAFAPAPIPFPVMHVDTGLNFPEVIEFRDRRVAELGLRLIVASVPDAIAAGTVRPEPNGSRNRIQTPVLLEAVREHRFTALFGGARRDEEKARAKERVFSFVTSSASGTPRTSDPSCGASTTAASTSASRSGYSRCRTGPSSTSGTTSAPRSSRSPSCTWPQRQVFERDECSMPPMSCPCRVTASQCSQPRCAIARWATRT